MKEVDKAKILGDMFYDRGNHNALITSRTKAAKVVITNIIALCTETTIGYNYIKVMLLLYKTVFVPSLIYNCQAWLHLSTTTNLTDLQAIQLKCLKRIMRTPSSTPNASTFLDLGWYPSN